MASNAHVAYACQKKGAITFRNIHQTCHLQIEHTRLSGKKLRFSEQTESTFWTEHPTGTFIFLALEEADLLGVQNYYPKQPQMDLSLTSLSTDPRSFSNQNVAGKYLAGKSM